MAMKIILRPDAGPEAGLGHLGRSLALGRALKQKGAQVTVVSHNDASTREFIAKSGFNFIPLRESLAPCGQVTGIEGDLVADADIVIIDSYKVTDESLEQIAARNKFLVIIDDLGKQYPGAQIVITSRTTPPFPYRQGVWPLYLCSPRYALLREEFADPPLRHTEICRNVLLTMGGSDPFSLTTLLSEALLEGLSSEIKVNVVLGPFFASDDTIAALAAQSGGRLVVHRSPFSMRQLMAKADLAVSAGGQTLLELAAMGIPAVVVQVAENQAENIRYFVNAGSTVFAGRAREQDIQVKVAKLITELASDIGLREKMSLCGQRTVDGKGASRAAEKIFALFGEFYGDDV
ncbi:UDP-N-acetylglucosamine transferase [Moorella thermoacetica]|uniref:UDP-N-acetylglucosamine transferase n=1 Tax=Neomoorella thermoacetica TaxID=1525 RepID=A0AAC9MTE3_NEOTH|nr:undecaprenyldiphospho-muramoylpentapeptide beta-N- acetylglucosaminyltransferase [Moorella thermoacetica]TYL13598.1 UDP-N-acetylglucosamine transferase [Moorella thermoacetica]